MEYYTPPTEVSTQYIDWISEQRQFRHFDYSWLQRRLEDLKCVVQQQQKELHLFFLTIDALQIQYKQYQQLQSHFIAQLTQEQVDQDQKIKRLERHQQLNEQKLGHLEQQLVHWRTDAAERREKKAIRQKQYHQVYFVPVINSQYKKKYMRARDQNSAVEQHLADLHRALDGVKDRLRRDRVDWTVAHQHRQTLHERRQEALMELDRLQRLIQGMKRAQSYWCQFDTRQVKCFMANVMGCVGNEESLRQLRLASKDYEEMYQDGLKRYWDYGSWDITFDCMVCHVTTEGWPYLDKATYLLCAACHQSRNEKIMPPILTPTATTRSSISMPSLLSSSTHLKPYVKKLKFTLNTKMNYWANNSLLLSRHFYRSILA